MTWPWSVVDDVPLPGPSGMNKALIPIAARVVACWTTTTESLPKHFLQPKGADSNSVITLLRGNLYPTADLCSGTEVLFQFGRSLRAILASELPEGLAKASVISASHFSFSYSPILHSSFHHRCSRDDKLPRKLSVCTFHLSICFLRSPT